MGLRVPQNQTVQSKYTAGKEYMFNSTYREYIGYYYELNNKLLTGKEVNPSSLEIIPINSDKVNKLLTNPSTFTYGKVSGVKINTSKSFSHIYQYDSNIRYFAYNTTKNLIKEINEETFKSLKSDSLYKTISLTYQKGFSPEELDKAELIIPGIKIFVSVD